MYVGVSGKAFISLSGIEVQSLTVQAFPRLAGILLVK